MRQASDLLTPGSPADVERIWDPARCLGLAEAAIDVPLRASTADLPGCTITFDVPEDQDATVVCVVPHVRCERRRARVVVHLTDGDGNVVKAATSVAQGRASDSVTIREVLPAGSGRVTRSVRAATTRGKGVANASRAGVVTLLATHR